MPGTTAAATVVIDFSSAFPRYPILHISGPRSIVAGAHNLFNFRRFASPRSARTGAIDYPRLARLRCYFLRAVARRFRFRAGSTGGINKRAECERIRGIARPTFRRIPRNNASSSSSPSCVMHYFRGRDSATRSFVPRAKNPLDPLSGINRARRERE